MGPAIRQRVEEYFPHLLRRTFALAPPKAFVKDSVMRSFFVALLLGLALLSRPHLSAAEAKRLNIGDYFIQLPGSTFEAPAKDWLKFLHQPKSGVYDPANGYLSCTGDGAQAPFEAALFRYKDDRPLLAVCQGELEGKNSKYLEFYETASEGRMLKVPRTLFPIANEKGYLFELPRKGRTVIVRGEKDRKVKAKYTWNGEAFVKEP